MTRFARTWVLRSVLALGVAAPALGLVDAPPAQASVSVAVQFDELLQKSKAVAVIVPVEQRSVWEGRFIITYTKVHVDDGIAGDVQTGKDVWVVTRGGTVGNIGQSVDGEPVFHVGHPTLAFLREDIIDDKAVAASGIYVVTGRAQGQYSIVGEEGRETKKRIMSHPAAGLLLPPKAAIPAAPKPLAREILEGKTLDEARAVIVEGWRKLHAIER